MRRIRILSQWAFGLFFIYLFMNTRYLGTDVIPYPVNAFFRLDPLAGIGSILAGRKAILFFWPLLILLPATALFGRFFCGWICPMGSMLDLFGRRSRRMSPSQEGRYYRIKEIALVLLLGASLFSWNLTGIADPLSLLIRSLTMGVVPPLERSISSLFDLAYRMGGPVRAVTEPLNTWLTDHILSFHLPAFRYTALFLVLMAAVVALELFERRFWCRNLCPLGALLGWFSWISPLGIRIGGGCDACGKCPPSCRMGAIGSGEKMIIRAKDCILCYDCREACPEAVITHTPVSADVPENVPLLSLSRRQFLVGAGIGAVFPLTAGPASRPGRPPPYLVRPPGAVSETDFIALCLRCGECMRVCLTNGLQPTLFEAGLEGIWSPRLVSRVGYCEYSCTLCGQVCPSGAIAPLDRVSKRTVRIGTAVINRNLCIPFVKPEECLVCEEHCPTPRKAIVFDHGVIEGPQGAVVVKQPRIVEDLCIGCGICETKCPLDGESAIRVTNRGEDRAAAT